MDSADPVEQPSVPASQRPVRASRRPRDMMISMLVLVLPVILLVGGYQLLAGRSAAVAVDPAPALAAATADGLPVLAAADLPADWVPISAVHQPRPAGAVVRVGYVTPSGGSLQLVQSNLPADELLAELLPQRAAPAGAVALAERSWQRYAADSGERALVWLTPQLTVLVTGVAGDDELTALAGSLR